MTSLQEEFDSQRKPSGIPFDIWMTTLPKVEQDQWIAAAKDYGLSNAALVNIARSRGAAVSKEKMTSWRLGHGFTR